MNSNRLETSPQTRIAETIFAVIVLAGILASLPGCAHVDQPTKPDQVNQLPGNPPQPWEDRGPLDSFFPPSNNLH